MMRRREFITLIGGAAAWPGAARAQRAGKLPIIGFLGVATSSTWKPWVAAFVQRLRELGWVDGQSTAIEYRWAEGAASDSTRSWLNSFGSMLMLLSQQEAPFRQQNALPRSSRLSSRWRRTPLEAAWSLLCPTGRQCHRLIHSVGRSVRQETRDIA